MKTEKQLAKSIVDLSMEEMKTLKRLLTKAILAEELATPKPYKAAPDRDHRGPVIYVNMAEMNKSHPSTERLSPGWLAASLGLKEEAIDLANGKLFVPKDRLDEIRKTLALWNVSVERVVAA